MSHEITLESAAEMAHQAEFICPMMEDYPHQMADSEISAMATLLKKLTGSAAACCLKNRHNGRVKHE